MKKISFARLAAAAIAALTLVSGCKEPDNGNGIKEEPRTNFFTYDGYTFDINSVVKYEKGATAVELWLSAEEGATSAEAIREAGDYVVLRTSTSYLGQRDYFKEAKSKDSYIRFTELEFAYGDQGTAYIEVSLERDQIKIDFLAEKLYTKAEGAVLSGSYTGSYSVEKEQPYQNEWGLDRDRNNLTGASFISREDGGKTSVILYEGKESEAVSLKVDPEDINKEFTAAEFGKVTLTYNGGVPFDLRNATGTISTSLNDGNLNININVTNKEFQLRAVYSGEYEEKLVKLNRYRFDYEGESPYEGEQSIVKLMVKEGGNSVQFYFSPSEGYTITEANSTHMPILTVPSSLINSGKKLFKDIEGWSFAYDVMEVGPFEDTYKPAPGENDWIIINNENGEYEIEMLLTGNATGMYGSSIDLYYKGTPKK